MSNPFRLRRAALAFATALAACAPHRAAIAPLAPLPFAADTARAERLAPGVVLRYIYAPSGPWAIHVLDVDLTQCNAAEAVKGSDSSAGRTRTSTLLDALALHEHVVGGVNADFFSLKDGTPLGLLIVHGRMLTPPDNQPALAFDAAGIAHIAVFTLSHDTLAPFPPSEAVGGRGLLVRDSSIDAALDTTPQPRFSAGRNPRTAAGIGARGHRLLLVTVDGREMPYSDGMSLRELAALMRSLGARDALNLDGGGSTTMVYADPNAMGNSHALRVANRPSDPGRERAVGDALAVVHQCR